MPEDRVPVAVGPSQETRPGPKTTEFWVTAITNVLVFTDLLGADLLNQVPDKYKMVYLAVVNALYSLSRGVAKQGIAYQPTDDGNRRG